MLKITERESFTQITDPTGRIVGHAFAEFDVIEYDDGRSVTIYPNEPPPGSVVLTSGEQGTAWQHHFADDLWHSTIRGRAKSWAEMLRQRNLILVYMAEERA